MTVTELRDSLNRFIEDNEKRGWSDRNNLPISVLARWETPTGQPRAFRLHNLVYVHSAITRMEDNSAHAVIEATTDNHTGNFPKN